MNTEGTIIETVKDTIKIVKFNKPQKKNAIDQSMYIRITKILNDAAYDNEISMVVLTGTGDFYSSGNDVSLRKSEGNDTLLDSLKGFIEAFIKFPKLLIAIVNGPAIGIAATTLALCDLVFASENAYFYTPFSKLHLTAEGASTFTFPRLIGQRKTAEMLLFNHKMSAKEGLECGFINRVFSSEELQSKAWEKIMELSKLPAHSVLTTKNLLRRTHYDDLLKANEVEIEELKKLIYKLKINYKFI